MIKQVIAISGEWHCGGGRRGEQGGVQFRGVGAWNRQNIQDWEVKQFLLFFWKNSSARINPTGDWTNAWGHWTGPCNRACSSRTFLRSCGHSPPITLEPHGHLPPPIFIPEATKVQIYMMQLADFIPRDRSMKRLSDLPKGIYWVNGRNGNKTQSPDAEASSPSLDTSPNGENNPLRYQIVFVFWWLSKLMSK